MEKAIFPMKCINISQGYNEGTHLDSYAVDNVGCVSEIENVYMPFTGTIKKIYKEDANEVWIESNDKVLYADGTIDYMTVLFCHDDNIDNLYEGLSLKQKEVFYNEGTKGFATGNHVHIECALGKFDGIGWHQNKEGYWSINNGKNIEDCLFITDDNVIINTKGYKFINVNDDNSEIIYIVKEGDTLIKIANLYNTTYEELAKYNNIENPDLIYVGDKIRIPVKTNDKLKVGDKVKVINNVQYNGEPFVTYYDVYDVLEINNDRIVIGIGNVVTAAVNINNLIKV